jgi:hypothetical protein
MTVEEYVPGEGKLLGDMFMKSAFGSLVKEKLKEHLKAYDDVTIDPTELATAIELLWNGTICFSRDGLARDDHTLPLNIKCFDGRRVPHLKITGLVLLS